jgi:adenylate kinase
MSAAESTADLSAAASVAPEASGAAATSGAHLLIVGPPGAGKGTQAARLSQSFGVPAIATGDIFRLNIKNGTELGQQVEAIVAAGDYVPDSLTNALVASRLEEDDAVAGFLLDGYPRTLDQVDYLDRLLADNGTHLDAVIQLVADPEELVARLSHRAAEQGRADDTEEAIRHRQAVYLRETAPLIDVFRSRDLLIEVDGLGAIDEVYSRVVAALTERGIRPGSA